MKTALINNTLMYLSNLSVKYLEYVKKGGGKFKFEMIRKFEVIAINTSFK